MTLIPVFVQYYDNDKNIVTKEVTHSEFNIEREIGIPATVTEGHTISIKYYDSDIKYARSLASKWAERNGLKLIFSTFILTADAKPEWWTIQPKNSSYINGQYNPEFISMYKKIGIGVIIRDCRLPPVEIKGEKKKFTEELIPF